MEKNKSLFEFKYEGQNFIDLNTLLTSQFHFLATFTELQKELYPDAQVKIKVGGFKEGSFIVELFSETSWIENLFLATAPIVQVVPEVLSALNDIISLKKLLLGKEAKSVEEKGDNYVVKTENNNSIVIDQRVFNIYKDSTVINRSIQSNFELLEKDEEILGIKISEVIGNKRKDLIKVDRTDFETLQKENCYLGRETSNEISVNERLFIKKPNLIPEKNKILTWGFLHKGRDITAKITDKLFISKIDDGTIRIGKGDRLIVDLKIGYKWDDTYMTFIENNKYEVVKVHKFIERNEQQTLDFNS